MSEEELNRFLAMEKHYQSIIKQLQEEIKELKSKLNNQVNNEQDSNFAGTLKMIAYEQVSKN